MANKQISGRKAGQQAAPALSAGRESRIGRLTRDALRRPARFRPDRFTLFLAALAVSATALVLLRGATYGVGLPVDSAAYISTARSLLEGKGFVEWNTGGYENAAPLFPLALAFAGLFGPDPVEAAGYVNAAAFGLTVFATAMWLRRRVRSRFLVVWAGCACALAPPLIYPAAEAATESLFILFVVISLFVLDRFLESGKPSSLYLAAACAALAWATRYPGIALVTAAALLLLLRSGATFRERARNAAVFAGAASAPVCLWLLRNFLVNNNALGRTFPTGFTPAGSLQKAGAEFVKWLLGEFGFAWLEKGSSAMLGISIAGTTTTGVFLKIAFLLALSGGTGLAILLLRRQGYLQSWMMPAVPVVFAFVYAFFLATALPLSDVQLTRRYLAPLYIPALVAAVSILDEFLRYTAEKRKIPAWRTAACSRLQSFWRKGNRSSGARAARTAPALVCKLCLGLWLAQQVPANYSDIRYRMENGLGYASRKWDDSAVVLYMKSRPINSCVWSTEARALYFLTAARLQYRDLMPNMLPHDAGRRRIWPCKGAENTYVVWFYRRHHARYDYGLKEVAALPVLEIEAVLEDGVIFKATDGKDAGGRKTADEGALMKAIRQAVLKDARHIIHADFDVYLDENGNRLIYLKEPCRGDDLAPKFFLKVVQVNKAGLPLRHGRRDFDDTDFDFDEYGFEAAGLCAAVRDLPDYAIAEIETGQWLPREDRKIWAGEFRPD